ncbi:peptidase M56 [Clostridioides sp. ES-S-0006-03]|uniref:M56 family metallopeptidase n=1 Tax=Clostridioides sp. ES-S-0006-03 TaxID=2770775 RepID=UPI001D0C9B37|nr:peptidase M56 [Clostridioides sp. ES-S-0006-03]
MSLILSDIFRTVLVSNLFLILLLVFRISVFKRFSKRFNYYIWFIVVIKLLLPFTYYTFTFNTLKYQDSIKKINLENFNNISISKSGILIFIWIIGAIVYLIYNILKYIKLKNLINDLSYEIDDKDIIKLYENLLKELKIGKDIKLKYTYEVETPAFFDSCVLLPPCEYTLKELELIFRHELIHFKNKDLYIKYLVLFLKCVYWFNPFMYIMDKIIDLDCELYCDERVLKNCNIEEKKEYALIIINMMRKKLNYSNKFVAGLHQKSDIQKRVYYMFSEKYKGSTVVVLFLCLFSSIMYLKLEFISTNFLNNSISNSTYIENRIKSKPTYEKNIRIENQDNH